MRLSGLPSRPVGFVLAVAAPLVIGCVRRPDLLFLPMIVLFPALAWFGSDRQARPAYFAFFLGGLWTLALPGLLAGAGPSYYAFYYTLSALLFLWLFPLAARHVTSKAGLGALLLALGMVAIACADYARAAGVLPREVTYLALYQSHLGEAAGYVADFVHPLTIVAILVLPALLTVLLVRAGAPRPRLPRRIQPVALGLAGVVLWQTHDASNEVRLVSSLAAYQQMVTAYRDVAALRRTTPQAIQARRTRSEPELHVIVIGESTNRAHLGLYGYPRNTTPALTRMADDLVVFSDVIASHSHTMHALPKALTLADVDNALDYADARALGLIEILRAAGVTTHWLSNQKRMGVWDDHVAVLAEAADRVEFVSRRLGRSATPGPDGRLLPAFRRALRDSGGGATVVFVHLMGTHWPYAQRYPQRFARFAKGLPRALVGDLAVSADIAGKVNAYDNAVRYQDHVIGRLIDTLRREGPPAASLLFFSDHGESVFAGTGHDASRFGRGHVEIPFLFWFSDGFEERHADLVRTLAANRGEPFMIDELEDAVLDLVGIETDALEPARSPFRPEFETPPRLTMDGTLDYDGHRDRLLNARRNLEDLQRQRPDLYGKTWAHRVDSLGKLSEAIGIFAGVELDLVFDARRQRFEVRHPPVPDTGLRLAEVLAYLQAQNAATRLWLDLKNVEPGNVAAVTVRLLELDRAFGLKERAIVETSFTGDGLRRLSAAGFHLSYYLPTRPIRRALKAGRSAELRAAAERIAGVVERHGASAVSFEFGIYPFVRDHLGALAERHGLDLLTWDLSLDSARGSVVPRFMRRDWDPRLAVILVTFRSRFDI
jgi:glucan phosphoethanolaminetransferase (alkaline phosphatase superfamily)